MKRLHLGIGLIVIVALGAFIGLNEPNKVAQEKRPTTKHEKIKKVDVNQTIAPSGTLGHKLRSGQRIVITVAHFWLPKMAKSFLIKGMV